MDIASLGIKVTTDGVQQAASDLDKLSTSSDKAAKSTSNLNKSFSQGTSTAPIKATSDAIRNQTAELAKLTGQIDPTIAKLDKLDAAQAKLAGFKKSGLIGAEDFAALNAALDTSRAKIGNAGEAVHKFSLNNSLARRELGYLAKDLALGNYGRFTQSSLTLANASGVMALAFSGVGIAVLGAVAALGIGVVAFAKGQAETDAFNKSLIQTGDYAGATAGQLASMAKATSPLIASQHAAAGALAAVVASGKFAGSQLQVVTDAALEMEKTTGQAIGETIKQFTSLADDPVNAIVKLNETQHFLTDAVYEQIKALQDQGRAQEAADLAENTYADSISTRTASIKSNLGTLETAWNSVKTAAGNAWSAMLNIGRPDDADQKLGKLQGAANTLGQQLTELRARQAADTGGTGFMATTSRAYLDQQIETLQNQFEAAAAAYHKEEHAQSDDGAAAAKAASVQRANELAITLGQEADKYASAESKRAKEIAQAHQQANEAVAKLNATSDAKLIAQIRANEAKVVAGVESREKKPKKPKADPFNSLNGLVQSAQVFDEGIGGDKQQNEQVKKILAIADAGAKLIASGKDVAKVQAQVEKGVSALNEGYAKQAKILDAENAASIKQYQASLDKQNDALQRTISSQIASISLGSKEAAQQQQINGLYEKNAQALTDLQLRRDAVKAKGGDTAVLDADIVALKKNIDQQVKIVTDGDAKIDAARANGLNGYKTAIANFMDQQKDVAGQMEALTTQFIGGFGDAFASFVSGAESAKSAFGSLIDSMYQQALKFVANKAIQALFDSFGAMGGGSASSTAGSTAGGWGSVLGNLANAYFVSGGGFGPGTIGAGLANGGPASAGSIHPVVENGPEILNIGARSYLMMGNQSGHVTPMSAASGAPGSRSPTYITNINVQPTSTRRTAEQVASANARTQRIAQSRNS